MILLNLFVSTKSLDALSFQSLFLGCPLRILPHQNLTPRNYLLPGVPSFQPLPLHTPLQSTHLNRPLDSLFSSQPFPLQSISNLPPPLLNSWSSKKPNLSPRLLLQSLFSIILSNFLKGHQSLEIIPTRFSATRSLCTNVPLCPFFPFGPSLPLLAMTKRSDSQISRSQLLDQNYIRVSSALVPSD